MRRFARLLPVIPAARFITKRRVLPIMPLIPLCAITGFVSMILILPKCPIMTAGRPSVSFVTFLPFVSVMPVCRGIGWNPAVTKLSVISARTAESVTTKGAGYSGPSSFAPWLSPGPVARPRRPAPSPGPVARPRRPAPSPGPVARPRRPAPSPGPVARGCRPWLSPVAVARGCRVAPRRPAPSPGPVARPRRPAPSPGPVARPRGCRVAPRGCRPEFCLTSFFCIVCLQCYGKQTILARVLIMTIVRKATGKRVGRVGTIDELETTLAVLPAGVYSVEDKGGDEIAVATVRAGRVTFAGDAA